MFNMEYIGLLATFTILISFLGSGEKKIRIFNMIGCILFVIYGAVLGLISIWLSNGILFFVHTYKIYNINKNKKIKMEEK